jgi:hypothetical protein
MDERIIRVNDKSGSVGKKMLNDVFKEWFQINHGSRTMPRMSELTDAIIKKFGTPNTAGKWTNIKIKYDDDEEQHDFING